jgi:LmbE family N-acetylglucosaminyl deacetylase
VTEEVPAAGTEPGGGRAPPDGSVMAIFAHPDDAEIAAGGTLARFAEAGRDVHLLVLTNGDRGSLDTRTDREELARIRAQEAEAAGRVLGVSTIRVLDTPDGELENSPAVRAAVVRAIRELRPAIVLSCDPTMWFFSNRYINHADHRTAGAVAVDSVFPGAGNPQFFSEQLDEGLEPWSVSELWLGWTTEANHYQDITGHLRTKLAAVAEHTSQVQGDMLGFFEKWLPKEAAEQGRHIGVEHAEAFRRLTVE